MKTAVVLFNLGGPLCERDIKPFLFNFFMDKNIIAVPRFFRWFIAKYISITRSKGAANTAYAQIGYKSPLLQNTQAQAQALEDALGAMYPSINDIFRIFISMRYWEPTAADAVDALEDFLPDHIVLLPLYPEYSTTTTKSSFENFRYEVKKRNGYLQKWWGNKLKVTRVDCYPLMPGFVDASADLVKAALSKAPANTRVLFSAHGLPEKIIAAGDPYQHQCEISAAAIAEKTGIDKSGWRICYQSRIGPLKWIGPSILEELERAAKDKVGVVVYPHAFVSEHVETLVELDIEYKKEAEKLGVPYFARVPTVSTHPAFISGLAELVQDALADKKPSSPCGGDYTGCGCREAA